MFVVGCIIALKPVQPLEQLKDMDDGPKHHFRVTLRVLLNGQQCSSTGLDVPTLGLRILAHKKARKKEVLKFIILMRNSHRVPRRGGLLLDGTSPRDFNSIGVVITSPWMTVRLAQVHAGPPPSSVKKTTQYRQCTLALLGEGSFRSLPRRYLPRQD